MDQAELRALLKQCPVIASVQADTGTPLNNPQTLLACAQASIQQGVKVLRLQGVENIQSIRSAVETPLIGLIKKKYSGSEIYITATENEVKELISTKCEIIAIDATERARPNGEQLSDLLKLIKSAGRLAMADCDSFSSIQNAEALGFDIISTTLNGYTPDTRSSSPQPNLNLLRNAREATKAILLAEGRFAEPWQVQAALQIGADGVVIGGAINDPIKQTRRFVSAAPNVTENIVGIDLGGTWLRAGLFSPSLELLEFDQIAAPKTHKERLTFIESFAKKHGAIRIGVSAGGTIDYQTHAVIETKGFIPDYLGRQFRIEKLNIRVINDGLATAWGHACHPHFAGKRVATLALGTGVGAGVVDRGRIITDSSGNYPRINDAYLPSGKTIEETLGGINFDGEPNTEQKTEAIRAAQIAIDQINNQFPDGIVICGGVGLSDWFRAALPQISSRCPLEVSPYGEHAGLTGAAALQIYPPGGLD
ncbi:MAG: putative N-acetylmannosamine-6-phosphate 2-epimerase [Fimbriimonadaceae bacterium]|nr:MAG: putative N-acetylmannosamine-6-phosphate 2-epimerase [Fimbriimonadaceae bacterium]